MSKLDDIWIQIHFKENGIPDIHAGPMTEESKQQIKDMIDGILFESDEPGSPKSLRSEADILEGLADL
jgi:hypothetical protein